MKIDYAIIVKNQTRLEALIQRFNTQAQARFYIESHGGQFADYEREHERFQYCLQELQARLSPLIKHKIVERAYLPNYIFAPNNLIIVIGQDGLVANTAKYSRGCPIVAVNPDEERYDGQLLPFNTDNFTEAVQQVLAQSYQHKIVRFAEARLEDGQRILAFNDLFIGAATHVSARYRIHYNQQSEDHSSSGIIVSTKAGATGWLSSIYNMARGISGGKRIRSPRLSDDQLQFIVREPFASIRTQTGICMGQINPQRKLRIESFMPSNGVIFSDGIERDFLNFNSGASATIGLAPETAQLVVHA